MYVADVKTAPPYFENYFKLIGENSLETILTKRIYNALDFYQAIPEHKWTYRYAEGKWTMQKVLLHVLDAEVIFLYRAMSIARGETQLLPGWSEDQYASQIDDDRIDKARVFSALGNQMNLTKYYFSSFNQEELERIGNANHSEVSVGAIGFAIAGHEIHHRNIIYERYL